MKGARTVRRGGNGDLTQDKQDIFAIYLERPHVPYPTVWAMIRKSVTSPTGAQWQTCRWPHQKAGVTNRRGRCGSRRNGTAWCCSASSRKWQVNICARVRRSTSKVSFAPVAGKITVSPVTSLKFLLRPRAPCRCWDVHHSRTLRRNRSLSRMGSHRVLTRRKKVARKRKSRTYSPFILKDHTYPTLPSGKRSGSPLHPKRGRSGKPAGGHVRKLARQTDGGDTGADRMASRGAVRQARGSRTYSPFILKDHTYPTLPSGKRSGSPLHPKRGRSGKPAGGHVRKLARQTDGGDTEAGHIRHLS